ncbi:aldo/keto reductase [Halosegnis longus]|uniref:aldo/keto reductase n=1 Tax=Halosegnis longus TaxID=2216012 RepID=UPI00096A2AF3|nr:aldo/keto reductase [Salella cibi]
MTTVPGLGLGTSGNDDPDQCADSVATALKIGYRHIDTAQMYDNEAAVGDGIAQSDVPREDIFLATKVHPSNLGYEDVHESVAASLDRLGLDTIDLLYVHWPTQAYDPEATLRAFDELYEAGTIDHVGVSNFTAPLVEEARDILAAPIVANQIEVHPLLGPREPLFSTCRDHDIDIVGYAPFCRGDALDDPTVQAVAERHNTSPAQVCLAWLASHDVAAIPKATGRAHIAENARAAELELTDEDIEQLDTIDRRYRRFDPDGSPWEK